MPIVETEIGTVNHTRFCRKIYNDHSGDATDAKKLKKMIPKLEFFASNE